jgi:acyl-CoA synthetase (AMP-forming)/AMP-acid ligase II
MKRLPDVEDCLVVGVADPRFGQRVVAVVALRPDSTATGPALMAGLRDRISSYKAPRTVHVVERIVRAANGKADYDWARSVAAP